MKLSIITLTLNKLEYTKKYIKSLYKYTKDFELIIIDNGSTDGTVEYLKSLPNIKLILNQQNLGFSKGNNQGLEIAEGEYIGFLNNDILLSPNWFEACENVFEKGNVGFVSPTELNPSFERVNDKNYLQHFLPQNTVKNSFTSCSFSCVITKKDVIDRIGFFDENYYPAFFEDNDLKYRAIEAGFAVCETQVACFYHYGSTTSLKLNYNFEKNRKYYYSKFPNAEYQMESQEQIHTLRKAVKYLDYFPINIFYGIFVFLKKATGYIKRKLL